MFVSDTHTHEMKQRWRLPVLAATAMLVVLAATTARAVTTTWTSVSAGTYQWTDSGNWSNGVPNAVNDRAIFPTLSSLGGALIVEVPTDVTVGRIDWPYAGGSGTQLRVNSTGGNIILDTGDPNTPAILYGGRNGAGGTAPAFNVDFQAAVDVDFSLTGGDHRPNYNGSFTGTLGNPDFNLYRSTSGSLSLSDDGHDFGTGTFVNQSGSTNFGGDISGTSNVLGGPDATIEIQGGTVTIFGGNNIDVQADIHITGNSSLSFGRGASGNINRDMSFGNITLDDGVSVSVPQRWGWDLHLPSDHTFDAGNGSTITVVSSAGGSGDFLIDGTFKGSTTYNGTVSTNDFTLGSTATIAPGNSAGTIVINLSGGTFTLSAGATYEADLLGSFPGVGYDQIGVVGPVDITNAILDADLGGNGSYGGYLASPADRMFILANDDTDAITGEFAGIPDGSLVNIGYYRNMPATARISYFGDSGSNALTGGNDIVLYDFYIPEPSVLTLMGLATLGLLRRRRGMA